MSKRPESYSHQQYQSRSTSVSRRAPAEEYTVRMEGDSYRSPNLAYARPQQYPGYFDETLSDELSLSDRESILDSTAAAAETPAIELERGHYLLNFSKQNTPYQLFDYTYRPASISLSSQLNGKFFYAANASGSPTGSTSAIICYRRNLFSVLGSITMPQSLRYISVNNGEHLAIDSTELHISACETLEGAPVKLINVPFKGAQAPGFARDTKSDLEPGMTPLMPFNSHYVGADYVSLPVEWKRLQFRVSTANNGRRKELQQHFVLSVRVIATLKTGQRVSIFEAMSEPIIVRGRSPRNFQPKNVVGSVTGRSSRSATVESSLALTKTHSEPSGSFEHMALPTPNYVAWQGGLVTSEYPSESITVQSVAELEQYTTQRSPALQISPFAYEDEDYFGLSPPKRSRGSSYQSPRSSPYPPSAFSGYAHQSSYEYLPPMPSSWAEQVDTMYQEQIATPLTMPTDTRAKAPRIKPKRHHSNGRH